MRRGQASALCVWLCWTILVAPGCKKPLPPPGNAISRAEADRIMAESVDDIRKVTFGKRFMLLGVCTTTASDGVSCEFVWKSLVRQKRDGLVPVHLVDDQGKILAQADFRQDPAQAEVDKDTIWRDTVLIPFEKLSGASSIGIGILGTDSQWLTADGGPRDLGNRRLLIPVPNDVPKETFKLIGFFEAATCNHLVGWACNKDDLRTPIEVEIYDGKQLLSKVVADVFRPDLQTAGYGDGRHGFRVPIPPQLKDGRPHSIQIRAAGGGFPLKNSPKDLTCH